MHTFHRGEQNHMSTLLTQWPKLWILKGQTFWIHQQASKWWHHKNIWTSAVTSTWWMSLNYNHISDNTIIFFFIYEIVLHSAKACTFCKREAKFIQASGSCWWLRDVFSAVDCWADRRLDVTWDSRQSWKISSFEERKTKQGNMYWQGVLNWSTIWFSSSPLLIMHL